MSSTSNSSISRTQSLRKPSATTPTTTTITSQRNAATGGTSDRTTRVTANGAGPATSAARGSRPLSGVFGRMTAPSTRQRDVDTPSTVSDAPTTTSRLTRATSIRQLSSTASISADAAPPSRLTRAASIRQISTASARAASNHDTPMASDASSATTSRLTRAASIRQLSNASTRTAAAAAPASVDSAVTPASRRPTTSSGLPPSSRPRVTSSAVGGGHTRAKSSGTTLTSSAAPTGLRPPSQGSVTSTSTTSTSTTTATTKPPPTRTASISTPRTTTTTAAVRPKSLHLPSTSTTQPPSSPPKGPSKPNFNTHLQSFTPLKPPAPKALTSTFLAPPSPSKLPANVAISAETAKLQTQLLQLHLLHRSSFGTMTEYCESARNKLGKRFEYVRDLEREVSEEEKERVEDEGIRELIAWTTAAGTANLESKIQVLDRTVQTVWVLTESGKYGKVVRRFQKWFERASGIMDCREDLEGGNEERGLELIGKVGEDWDREVEGLERKLKELKDGLRDINSGGVCGGSVGRIVKGLGDLVWGMVEELEVMKGLEEEVLRQEMVWVRRVNREGEEGKGSGGKRAGAIWRGL
ncbi:hypothetical protein QBC38DRAFT_430356 [Podospora fimiseda]|uniref:Uncharacterized protein n=1 Tax=Podospora fimiseda TaxID=252190 RepID=A0AAN6YPY0_9PEZI|nr:hypothetical protein QBC38DRAFT_430356 [Podospora fimiseda]